jgi:hypothetical protein
MRAYPGINLASNANIFDLKSYRTVIRVGLLNPAKYKIYLPFQKLGEKFGEVDLVPSAHVL